MNKKSVSISYIAKQLGVSASTVSRALNNSPLISEAITLRVQELARELNYVPNQMAVNLQSGRRNAIGVIVPSVSRSFFSSVIDGIEDCASMQGFDVLICQSKDDYNRERGLVSSIGGRVDGVIASLAAHNQGHDYYKSLSVPLVLFDRTDKNLNVLSVTVDDFVGAKQAVEHLLEQGFKKIFHFSGPRYVSIWENRYRGYLWAMNQAGVDVPKHWVWEQKTSKSEGERFARRIIESGDLPDAVFCSGDYAAMGMLSEFQKHGIEMPVVGFANEPFCELFSPPLSSVNQHSYKMGQLSARVLLDVISGEAGADIVLKPELIIRNSSIKK